MCFSAACERVHCGWHDLLMATFLKCCFPDLRWTRLEHYSEQLTAWRHECFPSVCLSQCSGRHIRAGARKGIWPSFLYATHSFGTAVMVQPNAEKSWIFVCSLFFNPAIFQKQYQPLLCRDPRKVGFFFPITASDQKIKDQTWHFVWKCGTRETKKVRVWCITGFWLGRCSVKGSLFCAELRYSVLLHPD